MTDRYTAKEPVLEVEDLRVRFTRRGRPDVQAVDGVSFSVRAGSTVGLVGESGCGKSVTSLAIMGLLPPRGVSAEGSVRFDGRPLLGIPQRELREVRGRDIAMIFQDPMSSLNPVLTIGRQITEVLRRHTEMSSSQARTRAAELLGEVGIPDPVRRLKAYPHQLSGGMRQRAMIAIALACSPKVLIADEPTTALDVTIQAQILDLLARLVVDFGTALVLITHDLGVVAGTCETVHVMYSGRIVEAAPRRELFANPRHPYTAGLLRSVPRLDSPRGEPLVPISGSPRDTLRWAEGCAFSPRCPNRVTGCTDQVGTAPAPELPLVPDGREHLLRCINPVTVDAPA